MSAFSKIFGSHSERELKRIYPIADKVESYKEAMGKLSDEELKDKTREFKKRLEDGATLDDLLPEAFATVREAAKRVLGMEHYRVQIIGGIILHQGRIAEMRTGEGKTLVSTLPAYLNALEGKGVCIVTVNDYLAKRDAEWMGQVHEFLGLKVGVVLGGMDNDELKYEPSIDDIFFEDELLKARSRDLKLCQTTVGPHRDDMLFSVDGVDIRKYGSQGQQRTSALSLKLSEIILVKKNINSTPVLLLDDVLSELDGNRQNYLLNSLSDTQTIITCTGLDEFVKNRFQVDKVFHVVKGQVEVIDE